MKPSLSLPRGIYCPSITFFQPNETQDLNLALQEEHTRYLISSGIQGIVLHGTTGESVLLSHDERNAITALVSKLRAEMNAEKGVKLIVGCSAQSTREVISMCEDAKRCGGDAVLVLPPSYWAKEMTVEVLADFYAEVNPRVFSIFPLQF
jgi:4-hydroxy-2-oxoglutarate aldolase